MFRSLVRLRTSLFGNSLSISTVRPNSQNSQFVLKYSTATVGKTVTVLLRQYSCVLRFLCFFQPMFVCFFLFPERKRFYQDVSISQGESKCQMLYMHMCKYRSCEFWVCLPQFWQFWIPKWLLGRLRVRKRKVVAPFSNKNCTFSVCD